MGERLNHTAPEEGDPCLEEGCEGRLGYEAVENCSCHVSPPCGHCETNPLVCLECGHNPEDDE